MRAMGSARLRMEALGRAKALALQHGKRVIFEEFGSKAGLRIRFADPQKRIRIKEMTELGLSQNRMWTPPPPKWLVSFSVFLQDYSKMVPVTR